MAKLPKGTTLNKAKCQLQRLSERNPYKGICNSPTTRITKEASEVSRNDLPLYLENLELVHSLECDIVDTMTLPLDPIRAEIYKERLRKAKLGKLFSKEHKQSISDAKKKYLEARPYDKRAKGKKPRYNPEEYRRNKEKYLERQSRYRENPEKRDVYLAKAREKSRQWYEINKEKRYAYNKRKYQEFLKLREYDAGRPKPEICEVCEEKRLYIVFDHNHETGKFRGWICDRCNKTLGLVNDNKQILESLIKYLD
jgi:hypothetical protein